MACKDGGCAFSLPSEKGTLRKQNRNNIHIFGSNSETKQIQQHAATFLNLTARKGVHSFPLLCLLQFAADSVYNAMRRALHYLSGEGPAGPCVTRFGPCMTLSLRNIPCYRTCRINKSKQLLGGSQKGGRPKMVGFLLASLLKPLQKGYPQKTHVESS